MQHQSLGSSPEALSLGREDGTPRGPKGPSKPLLLLPVDPCRIGVGVGVGVMSGWMHRGDAGRNKGQEVSEQAHASYGMLRLGVAAGGDSSSLRVKIGPLLIDGPIDSGTHVDNQRFCEQVVEWRDRSTRWKCKFESLIKPNQRPENNRGPCQHTTLMSESSTLSILLFPFVL